LRHSWLAPESKNNHHPALNLRHSWLDPESRDNHHPALNLRHSGLDPESSSFPVMDPGSMSPRVLGDVRDDVAWSLASSEHSEHGWQEGLEESFIAAVDAPLDASVWSGR